MQTTTNTITKNANRFAGMTRTDLVKAYRCGLTPADAALCVAEMSLLTGLTPADVKAAWRASMGEVELKPAPAAANPATPVDDGKFRLKEVMGSNGLYRASHRDYTAWKETQSRAKKSEAPRSSVAAGEGKAQNRPQRDSAADAACAKARSEWSNNVADCRASFGDEESYVAFRASVLTGGYRNLGTAGISGNRVTFADYLAWKQNGFKK